MKPRSVIGPVQEVAPGLHRIEKSAPSGWCWNLILLRLPGGGLLVHSPTWLDGTTFERVEAMGDPRVLFAPNHYHHLSLARFRERYPRALVVATETAIPRLARMGHEGLRDIEEATALLPTGASWARCEGTKSGEAWLSLPGEGGRTWVVCDAFFHILHPVRGRIGLVLRVLRVAPGLSISRTYRWLALRNVDLYRRWTLSLIESDKPRRLIVSHGAPLEDDRLPMRLATLVRTQL